MIFLDAPLVYSIPSINGLPTVHKPGVPLHPIVSFCTSPTYNLSKHLVRVLAPLTGGSFSVVRNSKDFASFIQKQRLEKGGMLVSCDVVSIFTKVPIV